jgi:tetratricopeptide (TPR) repeat protein
VRSIATLPALLLFLSGTCLTTTGQSQDLPALLIKLQTSQNDTDKVDTYYSVSRYYWNQNADSVLLMAQKGLQLATAVKFEKGMALCNLSIGVGYGMKGMYPQSLDHHLHALQLSEKLGLRGLSGNEYGNIAIIYSNMQDYTNALDYFRRGLQIAREFPHDNGVALAYLNIGDVFTRSMQLDSAVSYTLRSLDLSEMAHDTMLQSVSLSNLGDIYNKKLQPLRALSPLERSLQLSKDIHDPDGVANTYGSLAETYRLLGSFQKSITYAENSLKEASAIHAVETIKTSYHILYADYLAAGNYPAALNYRNLEVSLNDSMYSLEKEKQLRLLRSDYELQEKQHQVDLLQNERLRQITEIQQGRIRLYIIVGCTALLTIWAFSLSRSNRQRKRVNRLLYDHNEEMVRRNEELAALNELKKPCRHFNWFC